jgi:hypothetical protein
MKKLIIAGIVAIAAANQADAAPIFRPGPTAWYQGTWTCTIAHASNMKLFMTLGANSGRAAVREYPYYGQTVYNQMIRTVPGFSSVSFRTIRGQRGFITLRRGSTPGVMTGSGRIGTTIMLLTCAKS